MSSAIFTFLENCISVSKLPLIYFLKKTRLTPCYSLANVAQMVERVHGKDEVSGSIPDIGSKKQKHP